MYLYSIYKSGIKVGNVRLNVVDRKVIDVEVVDSDKVIVPSNDSIL